MVSVMVVHRGVMGRRSDWEVIRRSSGEEARAVAGPAAKQERRQVAPLRLGQRENPAAGRQRRGAGSGGTGAALRQEQRRSRVATEGGAAFGLGCRTRAAQEQKLRRGWVRSEARDKVDGDGRAVSRSSCAARRSARRWLAEARW